MSPTDDDRPAEENPYAYYPHVDAADGPAPESSRRPPEKIDDFPRQVVETLLVLAVTAAIVVLIAVLAR